jgi:hypothetical protein
LLQPGMAGVVAAQHSPLNDARAYVKDVTLLCTEYFALLKKFRMQ